VKRLSLFIVLILFATGCTLSSEEKMDILLQKIGNSKALELLYQQKVDGGMFVLYKDDSGFRHAFFSNKTGYWNVSANSELNPSDGFTWGMTNDPNIPKATFAGVITNDRIQKVIVRQKSSDKQAEIVKTEQGCFWFTYFDKLDAATNGQADPLKIEALSSEGNLIWKDGVYDGKYFRGETQ
jgi:hypothetical protein